MVLQYLVSFVELSLFLYFLSFYIRPIFENKIFSNIRAYYIHRNEQIHFHNIRVEIFLRESVAYDSVSGQKKFTVIGMSTLTDSPSISISWLKSMSGVTLVISCLKLKESFDNIFSTNELMVALSSLPSTDVIKYLNLVVNSGITCVPNFRILSSSYQSSFHLCQSKV